MNALDLIQDPEQMKYQKSNYDRALAGEYFSFIDEYGTDVEALTYWQNHYSPIMNQDREIIGLTCFVLNITALKRAQEKNQYLSYHDNLTGVYNRRYYEEVLARIDKERHLPISIIIGDLNGLKLVNDAFGHSMGDQMLKGAAEALSSACRPQDIIARWGGDEFIVLLPSTGPEEVEEIVDTAKRVCAQTMVGTIPVDVSFGWYTKVSVEESMSSALKNAEDYMYKNKIIESKSMRSDTIKAIMKTLHEKNPREEAHSKRVGELSRKIGKALHYSETEINTLILSAFFTISAKLRSRKAYSTSRGSLPRANSK
jgi:diguanylate cyclase (GGDEF)-like protein